MTSKTANGCIRYSPERVVAVLDSRHAGQTAGQVIGFGGDIPIVATVDEGLAFQPNALLIGIAPSGGRFPEAWRGIMRSAIARSRAVTTSAAGAVGRSAFPSGTGTRRTRSRSRTTRRNPFPS